MFPELTIAQILGGEKCLGGRISTLADFNPIIQKGFSWATVSHAMQKMAFTDKELAPMLSMSASTFSRKKKQRGRLTLEASDRLFRLARITAFATYVLESFEAARSWLTRPQKGLGGEIPLQMLKTDAGAKEVEQLLGRIEYSVLS